jgi:MFS family permease
MPTIARFSRLSPSWFLMLACCAQFLVVLDAAIVNIALPELKQALGFVDNNLQWLVHSYHFLFAATLILGGVLIDQYGAKTIFSWGCLIFTGASLGAGCMSEPLPMLLFRGLLGFAAGLIAPASLALIVVHFKPEARARAISLWAASASAGGGAGVALGGVILQWFSWPWIFWLAVPLASGLGLAAQAFASQPKTKTPMPTLTLFKLTLPCTLGLFVLMDAITADLGQAHVLPLLGKTLLALGLLYLFWIQQSRLAQPLIPLKLLACPNLRLGHLTAGLCSGAMFACYYFLTLALSQEDQFSVLAIGMLYVPMTLCMFLAAKQTGGKLVPHLGLHRTNQAGVGLMWLGFALLTYIASTQLELPLLILSTLLLGMGRGIVTTTSSILATYDVQPAYSGVAASLVNVARQIGGATGLGLIIAGLSACAERGWLETHSNLELACFGITASLSLFLATLWLSHAKSQRTLSKLEEATRS